LELLFLFEFDEMGAKVAPFGNYANILPFALKI